MSEWKTVKLGDENVGISLVDGDRGKNYPNGNDFFSSKDCLFLSTKNVRKDGFDFQETMFINKEKDAILGKGKLLRNDIVLTTRGTLGNVGFFNDKIEYDNIRINSGMIIVRVTDKNIFPKYIFSLFKSEIIQEQIEAFKSGSAQPQLPIRDIKHFEIPLPPFDVQKKIAKVLGDLDDKIELNRRMNETLEEMAMAVYRHYFVNFGLPPGAKEEATECPFGKLIEHPEMGMIPEGWGVEALDKVADFLNGLAMQKFPPIGNEFLPVIKIREMRQGITDSSDKASINIDSKYIVNSGDVLFSWSGSLDVILWFGKKGGLNQHLFKVTSKSYPKWLYYFTLKFLLPDFQRIASDKATTMGHIQRHHLSDAFIAIPKKEILQSIDKKLTPILNQIISTNSEIQSLTETRDYLLPRLLSGDVRVE